MQYTVQAGDTLSGIGARYGVPYSQITGYSSGNPNLIRPGEVVNIPDKSAPVYGPPSPTAAPAPTPAPRPATTSAPQYSAQPAASFQPTASSSGQPNFDQVYGTLYQGWDRASALADFNAGNWTNKAGAERYTNSSSSGFNSAQPTAPNLSDVYNNIVNPVVSSTNAQYDSIQAKIDAKMEALNAKTAGIKDNPYLSEATMSGRLDKLSKKANDEIKTLVAQQVNIQNKANQARADAQVQVGIATNQYNIQSQQYKDNLQLFNSLLTSGGLNNISGEDISQISLSTGLSSSMVQSIIDTSKKKNEVKPQLITIDDGTNQKVVAIDPNGNVINSQVVGTSTKSSTGGLTANQSLQQTEKQNKSDIISQVYNTFSSIVGPQGYVSKEDWAKMKAAVLASGVMSATEFDKEFGSFKNPEAEAYGYIYN